MTSPNSISITAYLAPQYSIEPVTGPGLKASEFEDIESS